MEFTIEEKQEIELLLEEASAWGLRIEVDTSAKEYIKEGHGVIDSYHYAYEDWIK
jgi:hypothetical protein